MKQRLLTPGPTPVPEETLLEMAKPVFYHRSAVYRQLLAEVTEDLKYIFCTKNPVLTLTASGTGGMEAAIASSLPPGSKVNEVPLVLRRIISQRTANIPNAVAIPAKPAKDML